MLDSIRTDISIQDSLCNSVYSKWRRCNHCWSEVGTVMDLGHCTLLYLQSYVYLPSPVSL